MSTEMIGDMNAVVVYATDSFDDPIEGFSPTSGRIEKKSRAIFSPIENGRMAADTKVRDPLKIIITGHVDMSNAYGSGARAKLALENMYLNKDNEFYSVQTRDGAYDNLILMEMPHDEDKDSIDLVKYQLVFIEAMVIQGASSIAANSDNNDILNSGYKQPRPWG